MPSASASHPEARTDRRGFAPFLSSGEGMNIHSGTQEKTMQAKAVSAATTREQPVRPRKIYQVDFYNVLAQLTQQQLRNRASQRQQTS